jgi:ABC-type multidrug transport system fused ATPase/permease subunit
MPLAEDVESRSFESHRWRRALVLLRPRQRLQFLFLSAARIAVGICDLSLAAAMYLLFLLLQRQSPSHQFWWTPKTVLAAALLTALVVVVRASADIISSRSIFRYIQNLAMDLAFRLTRGYSEMQWVRFVERNRSQLVNHSLNTTRDAADFYHRCIELLSGAVIVALMTAAFVYQSLAAACSFALALLAFYCVHRLLIRKKIQRAATSREAYLARLQKILADLFSAGKEIRTHRSYGFFHEKIRRESEGFAANHRRSVFLPQVARILAEQGTVLLFLALIVAIQLRQGDTHQLLSLLAFYFVLSRRLLPLVSQISLIAGQLEGSYENVRIIEAELAECSRFSLHAPAAQLPSLGFALELNQVSFWFHRDSFILRDINLALRHGEIVVLHGASGIGKSSLLNLIAGVLQPVAGDVRVDRAALAYVPQEVPLLDDTIRNNLLFGLPAMPDDDLMRAVSAANLAGFVRTLPAGLDTQVGDNGTLFSGGQRQRLGLARAILRRCSLLLLDEATSALDQENERQILANLASHGTAVLLATHRTHACPFAHRVFRLTNGLLIEEERPCVNDEGPALRAVDMNIA